MDQSLKLLKKIYSKKAIIGIVGLGFVGSALGKHTAKAGFLTFGFDIDNAKINQINNLKKKNFQAQFGFRKLLDCNIICICVPTPLITNQKPNLSYLKKACYQIAKNLKVGQLIIIESSVPVGTTRNIVLPILEKSGFIEGVDFYLANSPERIDPGNTKYPLYKIPKVVGGCDKKSLMLATKFYQQFVTKIVPISSLEAAELSKILENSFRLVNISFINELADYANAKGINIREVIKAASTKPFGFLAHYPSIGSGGYCIPVAPFYLLDDAKRSNISLKVLKASSQVNNLRPEQILKKAKEVLNSKNGLDRIKILIVGVSYKANSNITHGSVALKFWNLAEQMGAQISYHDPFVPTINNKVSVQLTLEVLTEQDLVVIAIAHSNLPYATLLGAKKPIIDTCHIL